MLRRALWAHLTAMLFPRSAAVHLQKWCQRVRAQSPDGLCATRLCCARCGEFGIGRWVRLEEPSPIYNASRYPHTVHSTPEELRGSHCKDKPYFRCNTTYVSPLSGEEGTAVTYSPWEGMRHHWVPGNPACALSPLRCAPAVRAGARRVLFVGDSLSLMMMQAFWWHQDAPGCAARGDGGGDAGAPPFSIEVARSDFLALNATDTIFGSQAGWSNRASERASVRARERESALH